MDFKEGSLRRRIATASASRLCVKTGRTRRQCAKCLAEDHESHASPQSPPRSRTFKLKGRRKGGEKQGLRGGDPPTRRCAVALIEAPGEAVPVSSSAASATGMRRARFVEWAEWAS